MKKFGWILLLTSQFALAQARDIYTNDDETRRPAVNEEFDMALELKGCTGYLIAPNVGASAAHCRGIPTSLRSGVALKYGQAFDGKIGKTLEVNNTYDYWIFEIKWNSGFVPQGMQLVPSIQTRVDELAVGDNATADKVYTVGFPVDKGNTDLYYAWGYVKSDGSSGDMTNNIGLINGNSGGGLFREMDNMLVSSVSRGPHAFGQPGWDNNDWNDSKAWNTGPAMWKVYRVSTELQAIFPNGQNRHRSGTWQLEEHSLSHQVFSLFQ